MIQSYNGKEPYIFISYSHKDNEAVLPLVQLLAENGFRVWYDNGIEAGTEWPEFIAERLMSSTVAVIFMTENAQDSHNCRREINFAIELKKELLVVYLESFEPTPGMRMQLGTLQALHRSNCPGEDSFRSNLLNAKILQECRIPCPNMPQSVTTEEPQPQPQPYTEPQIEKPVSNKERLTRAVQVLNESCNGAGHATRMKPAAELSEKVFQYLCRYERLCAPEELQYFFDSTLFGTGKNGYLLTERELIYTKYFSWKNKLTVKLDQVAAVQLSGTDYILITDRNGQTTDYYFSIYAKNFVAFFEEWLR